MHHARVITQIKPTKYLVVTKLVIMIMFAQTTTYFVNSQDGIFGGGDTHHRPKHVMFVCGGDRVLWAKSEILVTTYSSDTCGGGNPEPRC